MPHRLDAADPDFEVRLKALLEGRRTGEGDAGAAAQAIVSDVRDRGDAALFEYTQRLDGQALNSATIRVPPEDMAAAWARLAPELQSALELSAERIRAYHRRQLPEPLSYEDDLGIRLGYRWTPVDRVGLYVPGGLAAYPSSFLMNAIPAQVAGVERIVAVTPTPEGPVPDVILGAAHLLSIDEVYRIGGAQAVAALAYGTETVPAVDMIVGPGNAYVAAAKRHVYGSVGIDLLAGPSEILVIADTGANPDWIAADLLSQAEHDESAQAILIVDDANLGDQVAAAVELRLKRLPRQAIARASWETHGAIITVGDLTADAAGIANTIAPEHLELMVAEPQGIVAGLRHAGAIFIGAHTPEPIGDYIAGTNHVLPTAGSARFASGLGVLNFMKRTSIVECSSHGLLALGAATITLARAEALEAHAQSIACRFEEPEAAAAGRADRPAVTAR